MVAVSDDPAVRALAIAAGLPAYDSLPAAEKALASFRDQDRKLAERLGREPATTSASAAGMAAMAEAEATRIMAVPLAPSARAASEPAAASVRNTQSRPSSRSARRPWWRAAVLLLLLAGVGYGAYLFLPTANITLTPVGTQIAPTPFTVIADPNVAVSDVDAGVVPAELMEIPVSVSAEFPATGIEARETRATGTVRFRSENTLNDVAVLEGTVVATSRRHPVRDDHDRKCPARRFRRRARRALSTSRSGPCGQARAATLDAGRDHACPARPRRSARQRAQS